MPTHYAFIVRFRSRFAREGIRANREAGPLGIGRTEQEISRAADSVTGGPGPGRYQTNGRTGHWVEKGSLKTAPSPNEDQLVIDCRTFVNNVGILSRYLAAAKQANVRR